jgi:hypothetical protein
MLHIAGIFDRVVLFVALFKSARVLAAVAGSPSVDWRFIAHDCPELLAAKSTRPSSNIDQADLLARVLGHELANPL